MPKATWKPHEKHGRLTKQNDLPDSVYVFPKQRKEPLTDWEHVRNAVARFDQVIDVSDADRALAFANMRRLQSITMSTSRKLRGTTSEFILKIDPKNLGVMLRRKLDYLGQLQSRTRIGTDSASRSYFKSPLPRR